MEILNEMAKYIVFILLFYDWVFPSPPSPKLQLKR